MFELNLIEEFAAELGLRAERVSATIVAVDQGRSFRLMFENCPEQNDSMISFDGSDGNDLRKARPIDLLGVTASVGSASPASRSSAAAGGAA